MAGLGTVICLALVGAAWAQELDEGDACRTNTGGLGTCKAVGSCPEAVELVLSGKDIGDRKCSYRGATMIVCCANSEAELPKMNQETKSFNNCKEYAKSVKRLIQLPIMLINKPLVEHDDCAMQSGTQLVVNGDRCVPNEFPHMALLGFGSADDISWLCGGTLISSRYILTAGHCIFTRGINVSYALLGDTNVANDTDNEYVQQVEIVDIVPHPGFKAPSHYHDIALLKLHHDVTFSPGVRPACLHDGEIRAAQQLLATVTGWGKTSSHSESSDVLLKADLRIVDTADCASHYTEHAKSKRLARGIDGDTMLCAGDPNGKKDSCQGDSGGPLQLQLGEPYCMYGIIGVTSFGPTACASGGVPGVYTRVSHYRAWIESVVWPN